MLTADGTARLAALEAKFNPPAPPEPDQAEKDRVLLDLLERVAGNPDERIYHDADGKFVEPAPWLDAAIVECINGKKKRKLTRDGKKKRQQLTEAAMLGWMEEVAAGRGEALPLYARTALRDKGHTSALNAKKPHQQRQARSRLGARRKGRGLQGRAAARRRDAD